MVNSEIRVGIGGSCTWCSKPTHKVEIFNRTLNNRWGYWKNMSLFGDVDLDLEESSDAGFLWNYEPSENDYLAKTQLTLVNMVGHNGSSPVAFVSITSGRCGETTSTSVIVDMPTCYAAAIALGYEFSQVYDDYYRDQASCGHASSDTPRGCSIYYHQE